MQIAISGTHRVGKTSLVKAFSGAITNFVSVCEPYYLLEEEGHSFSQPPQIEEYELQLERSIQAIHESVGDCVFDRCPLDLMAYLSVSGASGKYDVEQWLPRIGMAMDELDLIVFVPIEDPDRIVVAEDDFTELRQLVHQELEDIVLGDRWALGIDAIEVTGTNAERVNQVQTYLG